MASFNKIILVGRLTRDPEIKYTPQGTQLTKFSLAVDRKYQKDKNNKEVSFFNITAWARLAEICAQFLKKGKQVLIEGEMQENKYINEAGDKKSFWQVNAENMQMLGSKNDNGEKPAGTTYNEPKQKTAQQVEQVEIDEFDAEDMPF